MIKKLLNLLIKLLINKLDTNGDGKVSRDEVLEIINPLIDKGIEKLNEKRKPF